MMRERWDRMEIWRERGEVGFFRERKGGGKGGKEGGLRDGGQWGFGGWGRHAGRWLLFTGTV